jgi:hypothetical protein
MLYSEAYKELSNASRVAFLLLRAQTNTPEQNEVIFPYSQAEKYMRRGTFSRSIRQLREKGFIEKKQFGGLFRKTNLYSFIDSWKRS